LVGLANSNSVVHGKYTRLPQRPTNFIQQVLGLASSACLPSAGMIAESTSVAGGGGK